MACNLALTITTAAVTDEQLRALATPAVALAVLRAVMADQQLRGVVAQRGESVVYQGAGVAVQVTGGKVTARGNYGEEQALAEKVAATLTAATQALYQRQIAATMLQMAGKVPAIQRGLTVEKAGVARRATMFSVDY